MNTLIIEQSAADAQLAFLVHRNSSLTAIRLSRGKVASTLHPEDGEFPLEVGYKFQSRLLETSQTILRISVAFRMSGSAEAAEGPALQVEAVFEADYSLQEGFEPDAAAVRAFKDGNAIFNLWPYFREYLQSSVQRMGLPALTAPFLRLQPKARKAKLKKAIEGGKQVAD